MAIKVMGYLKSIIAEGKAFVSMEIKEWRVVFLLIRYITIDIKLTGQARFESCPVSFFIQ